MKLKDNIPNLEANGTWLNGREIRVKELIGNPTLFYFWSISCNKCKKAIPLLHQLRAQYPDKFKIISIHTPLTSEDNNMAEIRRAADHYHIREPLFVDWEDELSRAFKIKHVPAYYIFNEAGQLMHYQSGTSRIDMLKRRLERVLK